MDEANWRSRYDDWLRQAKPLLDSGEYAEAFRTYPWVEGSGPPFTAPQKPLHEMTVALVTSGGLSLPGQAPFRQEDPLGDMTFRWISGAGPLREWHINHGHYDPTAATEDYNVVFPLDALRELREEGVIGRIAPRQVSFMGYQTDAMTFVDGPAAEIADGLIADDVDAVLLVPV